MGVAVMAKKKASSSVPDRPVIAVTIRGSAEWKAWVEAGADFCRTDVTKMFDAAIVDYLKARGFPQEAPRR